MLTLALVLLTKNVDGLTIQRPGALHRARWMAKLLYAMKMLLLSDQIIQDLPKGAVFATNQLPKLKEFVKFVLLVKMRLVTEHSRNDLVLDMAKQPSQEWFRNQPH